MCSLIRAQGRLERSLAIGSRARPVTASTLTGVNEAASRTNDGEVCAKAVVPKKSKASVHSHIVNVFFIGKFNAIEALKLLQKN